MLGYWVLIDCSVTLPIAVSLAVTNLESYLVFLRKRTARFTIKALLDSNEVVLEPDAAFILDGSIKVIKNILDGTRRFVRFYRSVNELNLKVSV